GVVGLRPLVQAHLEGGGELAEGDPGVGKDAAGLVVEIGEFGLVHHDGGAAGLRQVGGAGEPAVLRGTVVDHYSDPGALDVGQRVGVGVHVVGVNAIGVQARRQTRVGIGRLEGGNGSNGGEVLAVQRPLDVVMVHGHRRP